MIWRILAEAVAQSGIRSSRTTCSSCAENRLTTAGIRAGYGDFLDAIIVGEAEGNEPDTGAERDRHESS
jgi:hypothetical protein